MTVPGSCCGKAPLAHLAEARTVASARGASVLNFDDVAIAEEQGGEGGTAQQGQQGLGKDQGAQSSDGDPCEDLKQLPRVHGGAGRELVSKGADHDGVCWSWLGGHQRDAHDLSYYEAPLKMLAGDVRMPAIFLKAPAVLERQLTAFCIDRWIESSSSARIPEKMELLYIQLSQDTEKAQLLGAFPNALYQFIELHLTLLIEGFVAMFDRDEPDKDSIDYLRVFIQGDNNEQGSLSYKIISALAASHKDREGGAGDEVCARPG